MMFKVIAHRGASREEPENTIESIKTALSLPVDYIEIDVQLSEDGIPVVLHDNTLCRTTNAPPLLHVRKTHSMEITSFDAGFWFHKKETYIRVPTLQEVLDLDFGSSGLMIEIKDDVNHDLSSAVFALLKMSHLERYLIGSFSAHSLSYFHAKHPSLRLIGIINQYHEAEAFTHLPLKRLAFNHEALQTEEVIGLASRYEEIWAYSVDDKSRALELERNGVKGIITNHPRQFCGA